MKRHIIWGLIAVGVLILWGSLVFGANLPYKALEDLRESDIVDRGASRCGEDVIPSFALHPGGKGWWMMWITTKGWILAYFGDGEEPPGGTRSNEIYYGHWDLVGEQHLFTLDHHGRDPGPERASESFCDWLVETEKTSA